jgi:hypothetical protein
VPTREHFDNLIDLLSSECEVLIFNPGERFDECTYLHGYQSQKCELFSSNPPSKKWAEVCVHLKENIVPHGNVKEVVELLLRLPGSNASIERAISCINYI